MDRLTNDVNRHIEIETDSPSLHLIVFLSHTLENTFSSCFKAQCLYDNSSLEEKRQAARASTIRATS